MKSTIAAIVIVLVGAAFTIAIHYKHKREDAVVDFALSKIDTTWKACRKPYETPDCERYPAACKIPLDGCRERAEAAFQEWQRLYPRRADERHRQRDEKEMLQQQGR